MTIASSVVLVQLSALLMLSAKAKASMLSMLMLASVAADVQTDVPQVLFQRNNIELFLIQKTDPDGPVFFVYSIFIHLLYFNKGTVDIEICPAVEIIVFVQYPDYKVIRFILGIFIQADNSCRT